ncbi:MAG: 50S ribosomal protein L4 [Acidobacteriota bacterium]
MPKVDVRNLKNKVVEKLELSEDVFEYEASETLVWEAVTAFLAAQRKGTHSTRGKSDVRGGGCKPWRQKGTGRARVGSIRSPLWAGGGTVHGPSPRNYTTAFPKKKRRGAVKLVLTDKLKDQKLLVVDDFTLKSHRTSDFITILKQMELTGKILLVDSRENRNLYLSSRNLPGVKMVPSDGVNIYDLLNCEKVIFSKDAIVELQEVLQK